MKRQTKAHSMRIGKRVDGINVDIGFARGRERAPTISQSTIDFVSQGVIHGIRGPPADHGRSRILAQFPADLRHSLIA
jgi:hypothetical protein